LRRGLQLIDGESKWKEHFDLAFELMGLLAKTELIVGNFDECKAVTRDALLRSKSVHQQLNLLLINMEVRMAENDVDQSIAVANESLNILGVKVPSRISMLHVVLKLLKVKRLLGRKSDKRILALPLIKNQLMASAIMLLFNASAYFAMKNAENEAPFYSLLAVELTLRYGLSPYSAPAFAMCGMIEVFLGNHMRGYRFGKLALAMLEQMECKEVECATLIISTSLSSHFQDPINGLIGSFDHAMDAGLESGDVVWGIYSLSVCSESRCMIGQNLAAVEEFQRERYLRAAQFGQEALLRWSEPSMQYVLNLQCCSCNWRDLLTLSGGIMDEDEYIKFGVDANNELILWTVWFFKMQLAYHFGVYHVAERYLPDLDRTGDTAQANFSVPLWYYLAASIHYELYHRFPSEKRSHLKAARKYHKAVKRLSFSPNSTPFLTLLAAEEMSARGKAKPDEVVAAYDRAIGAMAATGWTNMKGLANERVGFYMVRVGDLDRASSYFDRAMYLYRHEWGALAKYEWLLEKSEQLLGDCGESRSSWPTAVVGNFQTCA
jgi:predicted ATPase